MKTPMLGLRTTIYKVDDINKAKACYSTAFQAEPYFDEPFYVGYNIAGYELGLQPEKIAVSKKSANAVTYWGVKNIEKEYKRLLDAGAEEHEKPEKPENVGGEIIVAAVKDPWGNVIGLIYNPEFKLP